MVATVTAKVCTSTNAATETTATNWNLMSTDAYDNTGSLYQTNNIQIPAASSSYSYERWVRWLFTGTFTAITNAKVWGSTISLPTNSVLDAGETDTGVTPVVTASSVANTPIVTSEGTAIDITPAAGIEASGAKTDYFVMQLEVPSTTTPTGDSSTQVVTLQYDES